MKSGTLLLILLIIACLSISKAQGQQTNLFTIELQNQPFTRLASEIEQKSDYKFFFNPASVDSLMVTVSAVNQSAEEILSEVFKNTEYRYALDANQYIYITIQDIILTELPSDFYDRTGISSDTLPRQTDDKRFEDAEKIKVEKLISIGVRGTSSKPTASVAGYIRNRKTGEPVIGASVLIENPLTGVATDPNGYYSITLTRGTHALQIRSMGMKNTERNILLHSDGKLNIELEEDVLPLKEVIVESERDERVLGLQMGLERIDIKTMKQIPVAMGEADILKAVLTLPGVQSVGEATVGFNVRGGATDQNLILFNDATIYNPSI